MRRHIAAKVVHLFAFGTVSLVKQLQAWFISAPPDKEPKHCLMMPNHVSTLPGSSSFTICSLSRHPLPPWQAT